MAPTLGELGTADYCKVKFSECRSSVYNRAKMGYNKHRTWERIRWVRQQNVGSKQRWLLLAQRWHMTQGANDIRRFIFSVGAVFFSLQYDSVSFLAIFFTFHISSFQNGWVLQEPHSKINVQLSSVHWSLAMRQSQSLDGLSWMRKWPLLCGNLTFSTRSSSQLYPLRRHQNAFNSML